MNGGYILIDCTGLDISSLGKVDGLHERVKVAMTTHKNIILSNVENDGYVISPCASVVTQQANGDYHFSVDSNVYNIATDDTVTAVG